MKYIGAHVSISGGVQKAPGNAAAVGAGAFAMFTKNQKQWHAKPYTRDMVESFKINLKETGIDSEFVLPHDSYLINLGNPDPQKRLLSLTAFVDEIRRVESLGLKKLNFHPGAHLRGYSEDQCLKVIAGEMNTAMKETEHAILVIENTAGQGSSVGYTFEHLASLIELSENPDRVGVCLDTCHLNAAGYDLRTQEKYEETMERFSKVIGFEKLMGVHLNDAKTEFAKKVDRHSPIGAGLLGMGTFEFIMRDTRFDNIPLILETPEQARWPEEIVMLRKAAGAILPEGD
ncbi:MAG: deoxyribonuclease IV [Spirochaetia bacterium]